MRMTFSAFSAVVLTLGLLASTPTQAASMAPEQTLTHQSVMGDSADVAYNQVHDEYLAVWSKPTTAGSVIMGQRRDRFGRAVAPAFRISPDDGHDRNLPRVACEAGGQRYLVVYMYDYSGDMSDRDIYGRFVDWNGPNPGLSEIVLSSSGDDEVFPAVAESVVASAPVYLVTWTDLKDPTSVLGALGSFGSPPATSFVIASDTTTSYGDVSAAYQWWNHSFLVAYDDGQDVLGRMVAADGSGLGAEITIAGGAGTERYPSVASCQAGKFVVAWESHPAGAADDIWARILDVDGRPDAGTFPVNLSNRPDEDTGAHVACIDYESRTEKDYLVTWATEPSTSQAGYSVAARRIDDAATMRPAFALHVHASHHTSWPGGVAGGAGGWFVLWDSADATTYTDAVQGRVVWDLFVSGFETGDLSQWSSHQ